MENRGLLSILLSAFLRSFRRASRDFQKAVVSINSFSISSEEYGISENVDVRRWSSSKLILLTSLTKTGREVFRVRTNP